MKTLIKNTAFAFAGIISFSFTTIDDKDPKIVIVDIVDNIETTNNQNLTSTFKQSLDTINQADDIKILDWKEIANGLDDTKKQVLLDSIQPDVVLTLNFKNSEKGNNAVTAVVFKGNKHFDESLSTARDLTNSFDEKVIKNEGVFQAESKYIQDNATPAIFLSVETLNDQPSNSEIVSTLTDFIKNVKSENEDPNEIIKNDSIQSDIKIE
ncbi:hypothetical protein [Faecalibacter bovis]|uniref:DUF1002 domain-containing protein n=1 Tax=Faecalibacter bovis TaxID=2898187 RepID=A0ABX7X9Y4_9FLAO|nr:hypothetical protein [Faecalibacter bovis]MBS7332375.1 hypothetical protein [Weeksellaceae bacterium]QTV04688.1 hypothetical protein J9309_07670 [Faecalibacter bovis]